MALQAEGARTLGRSDALQYYQDAFGADPGVLRRLFAPCIDMSQADINSLDGTAVALFGFLRIATNRRIFEEPLALPDALARVETWLERSIVTFLGPGPRHLETAFELLRELGTGGNLTMDVQLAAYAIENQAELCSNDLDFGRFAGLRWTNPLAA